jgi:hypothetical protein
MCYLKRFALATQRIDLSLQTRSLHENTLRGEIVDYSGSGREIVDYSGSGRNNPEETLSYMIEIERCQWPSVT